MSAVSTVEARNQFSEVLNRAAYGRERVVLTRRGKPIAAVISIDDLRVLERLIEQIEDAIARKPNGSSTIRTQSTSLGRR